MKSNIQYEPLTPTGFFMGRLDVSNLPIDKACAWVKKNRSKEGTHKIHYTPTQREDIPLGDEKGGSKSMSPLLSAVLHIYKISLPQEWHRLSCKKFKGLKVSSIKVLQAA